MGMVVSQVFYYWDKNELRGNCEWWFSSVLLGRYRCAKLDLGGFLPQFKDELGGPHCLQGWLILTLASMIHSNKSLIHPSRIS